MALMPLPALLVEEAVRAALLEDLGHAGDITTEAVVPASARAKARIAAREAGVLAGLPCAETAFRLVDPAITVTAGAADGDALTAGQSVLTLDGPARGVLTAERVALNFLGHLSGIATQTRALVDAVAGTDARITCTRKTTPGLRALEKYAVRAGGGINHRFGLDDAVLIKDNHIAAVGGVGPALEAARRAVGHMVRIEIEVDRLDQLDEALAAGAEVVLLDNMSPETLREAVTRAKGRAVTEASGRVGLATVRAIAEAGVDYISSGALTHSAPTLDLGLDFDALG